MNWNSHAFNARLTFDFRYYKVLVLIVYYMAQYGFEFEAIHFTPKFNSIQYIWF